MMLVTFFVCFFVFFFCSVVVWKKCVRSFVSVVSWNVEDFFFFLPVCGRKLLSCLLRESQQIWVMYGFLFLFLFDGLWTIDRLSILPMTYQRSSPSPFLLMVIWILHDLFLVLVNLFFDIFPQKLRKSQG